jgi:pSer/pThr/pTyr-binding forkhead associated (FHA) protein
VPLPQIAVSRYHCRIVRRGNQFFVENMHSLGGFFVNDERIGDARQLAHGDRIRVCDFTLVFEEDSELEAVPE